MVMSWHMRLVNKYNIFVLEVLKSWINSRGHFCASVGAVDEDTIKRYIKNQKWEDLSENFKITALSEP